MQFRRAILHLGLHKTGTTSLQNALAAKREILAGHGVHYIPLEQMRRDLTSLLTTEDDAARREVRTYLDAIDQPVLLLSDENIIGGVTDPLWGHVYRDAEWRIRSLASLLEGAEIDIFIALRSPETFFPALYSEHLRHGRYVTFADYVSRIGLEAFSYRNVFGWIARARLPVRWHFVPLEAELGGGVEVLFDQIAAHALGEHRSDLGPFPQMHSRPSLKGEEMELVEAAVRHGGTELALTLVKLLSSRDERLGARPYRPIDAALAAELHGRYRLDIAHLLLTP